MTLTWREVSAPVLDTRGLAQAGQQITSSFDRLGQMFIERERTARSDATDKAIAAALALQDPEAVSKLAAQGTAGLDKRVDSRGYMEALGLRQNQLIDTTVKRNQLQDMTALTDNAAGISQLRQAAFNGDQAAMQTLRANLDPRALKQVDNDLFTLLDTANDNKLDRDQFGENVFKNRADIKDAAVGRGIQNQELALRRAAAGKDDQLRALQLRAALRGEADATASDRLAPVIGRVTESLRESGITSENAATTLAKTDFFKKLTQNDQKVFLADVGSRLGTDRTLTEEARVANGLDVMDATIARNVQRLTAKKETATREFQAQNPAYYIASRMAEIEKTPSPKMVMDLYEKTVPWIQRDRAFVDAINNGDVDPRAAMVALQDFTKSGLFGTDDRRIFEAAKTGTAEYANWGPERGRAAIAEFATPLDKAMAELQRTGKLAAQEVGDGRGGRAQKALLAQLLAKQAKEAALKATTIPRPR